MALSKANERKERALAWRSTLVVGFSFWAVVALGVYLLAG
jgi:hypothetical protein